MPSHDGTLANVPSRAHWRHLTNTIELVVPSTQPSPQPKRQIDRFSHFSTAHGSYSYHGIPVIVLWELDAKKLAGFLVLVSGVDFRTLHHRSNVRPPGAFISGDGLLFTFRFRYECARSYLIHAVAPSAVSAAWYIAYDEL